MARRRTPEIVAILSQSEIREMKDRGEGGDLLLNDEVTVLEHPRGEDSELVELLDARGLYRPGLLLLRSPYDDLSYADQAEARELFATQKHFAFSTLCSILGARSVEVEALVAQTHAGTRSLNLGAGGTVADGSLKVEDETLRKLAGSLKLNDRFEGGEPNVEAARNLLQKKRLLNDPLMLSLVELAAIGNRHQRRQVTLNLTEESKNTLRVAGRLTVPAYIKIDVRAQQMLKENREYSLKYTVEF